MADRKARSVTFRTPERIGLGDLKAAIQKEMQYGIVVFQVLFPKRERVFHRGIQTPRNK